MEPETNSLLTREWQSEPIPEIFVKKRKINHDPTKGKGVVAKLNRIRARNKKNLLKLGWTTDGVFWYNPRSGYRYDYLAAHAIEELRSMTIDI